MMIKKLWTDKCWKYKKSCGLKVYVVFPAIHSRNRCQVLSKNIHPLSCHAGLHETKRIYRNGMAPSTYVRWILVFSLRLRMRRGGSTVCATSGIHEFSQFLAGGKTLEEIRARVHDRPHQPQSLHQYKNLGENQSSNPREDSPKISNFQVLFESSQKICIYI